MDADHDLIADQAEHHQCHEEEQRDRRRERHLLAVASAHVLWHTGNQGGHAPGSYIAALLKAWDHADTENHALLATSYPEHGWAVTQAKAGGFDLLRHTVARAVIDQHT